MKATARSRTKRARLHGLSSLFGDEGTSMICGVPFYALCASAWPSTLTKTPRETRTWRRSRIPSWLCNRLGSHLRQRGAQRFGLLWINILNLLWCFGWVISSESDRSFETLLYWWITIRLWIILWIRWFALSDSGQSHSFSPYLRCSFLSMFVEELCGDCVKHGVFDCPCSTIIRHLLKTTLKIRACALVTSHRVMLLLTQFYFVFERTMNLIEFIFGDSLSTLKNYGD